MGLAHAWSLAGAKHEIDERVPIATFRRTKFAIGLRCQLKTADEKFDEGGYVNVRGDVAARRRPIEDGLSEGQARPYDPLTPAIPGVRATRARSKNAMDETEERRAVRRVQPLGQEQKLLSQIAGFRDVLPDQPGRQRLEHKIEGSGPA